MDDAATVFIVDDDPAFLCSLAEMVEVLFPRVETFTSAADFLGTYDADRPGCLVLDVAMPGMTGLELQQRLREDKIELPVIFMSAYATVQMAVTAMQCGAVDFLEKPFQKHDLWERVRRALEIDQQTRRRKIHRRDIEHRVAKLTKGESEVLHWLVEGKANKEVAEILGLSVRTVEDRRARVMKKMQARSLAQLVQMALTR